MFIVHEIIDIVSGSFFCTLNHCYTVAGKEWIKQMLAGAGLFPSLVCGTVFLINFVAMYYHASRAIPFTTMVSTN